MLVGSELGGNIGGFIGRFDYFLHALNFFSIWHRFFGVSDEVFHLAKTHFTACLEPL